jgi:hypothetical protein
MVLGVLGNGVVEYNFGDAELLIMLALLMGLMATPFRGVLPIAFEEQSATMPKDTMMATG